jgi:hypothetical protein
VLGYEGFELHGSVIHPRLDLIYDTERRPDVTDPCVPVAAWPENLWVDVVSRLPEAPRVTKSRPLVALTAQVTA